jgi:hypothetical protein
VYVFKRFAAQHRCAIFARAALRIEFGYDRPCRFIEFWNFTGGWRDEHVFGKLAHAGQLCILAAHRRPFFQKAMAVSLTNGMQVPISRGMMAVCINRIIRCLMDVRLIELNFRGGYGGKFHA